ncbi:hypothetical protein ACFX13_004089 [Malus domestica]
MSWKLQDYTRAVKFRTDHSSSLRFLAKSGRKEQTNLAVDAMSGDTMLVEQHLYQRGTLSFKQCTTLGRSIGLNFQIPPACADKPRGLGSFLRSMDPALHNEP